MIDVVISAARVTYDGAPAVMLQLRDISEQVAATRALQESERSWRALFGASPVGIGLSDEHGRFAAANAALCALLGRPERDVLGHSSAEFTHPDDLESHSRAGQLIEAASDGVVRLEKRYVRPGGEIRWAWLTVTHVPGPTGQTWTMAHVQDVTDRKAAEQAIADSEANLKAVADVVRHIQSGSDPRQTVVDAALDLAQASYASLVEPDSSLADGTARLIITATTSAELLGQGTPVDGGVVHGGGVPDSARRCSSPTRADSELVAQPLLALTGARSLLAVPVRSASVVTGVLIVGWSEPIEDLDDRRASRGRAAGRPGRSGAAAGRAGRRARGARADRRADRAAQPAQLGPAPGLSADHEPAGTGDRSRWRSPTWTASSVQRHPRPPGGGRAAGRVRRRHPARDAGQRHDGPLGWRGVRLSLPSCGPDDARVVLDRLRGLTPMGQTCSIGFATWDGVESADALLARADRALYDAKSAGRDQTRSAD